MIELVGKPRTAIDVGCGLGTWLSVLRSHGLEEGVGVDGPYVNRSHLEIPNEWFRAHDLAEPLHLGRRFDLVLSLETAEHLEENASRDFVASLTALGPVVLFSAAAPHQPGRGHRTLKWPSYWAEIFDSHGYVPIDRLRLRFWEDPNVRYFYAQNMILYVSAEALGAYPRLQRTGTPLPLVHPQLYLSAVDQFPPRPSFRETGRWLAKRLLRP